MNSIEKRNGKKFADPKILIEILEHEMRMSIKDMQECIANCNVFVTSDDIKEFLNQAFEKNDPEMKQRMQDNAKKVISSNIAECSENDNKVYIQRIVDQFNSYQYTYSPDTFEWFQKYILIMKKKCLKLLEIIEKIGNKNTESIKNLLIELDIILDKSGNISYIDAERLIEPTKYNIDCLLDRTAEAYNLGTYLTFEIFLKDLFDNFNIYPFSALQQKNVYSGDPREFIPLTEAQEKQQIERKWKNQLGFIEKMDREDVGQPLTKK